MKNINNSAPVKCRKKIIINVNCKKVWEMISDINNWTSWQTDIISAKLNGELKPQTTFDWKTGGVKIHSTLHTVEPYNLLGWTGKAFGTFAVHNWKITEKERKTEVLVEESMEGPLAKLFKKFFNKNLSKGIQTWLDLLKKECEN